MNKYSYSDVWLEYHVIQNKNFLAFTMDVWYTKSRQASSEKKNETNSEGKKENRKNITWGRGNTTNKSMRK